MNQAIQTRKARLDESTATLHSLMRARRLAHWTSGVVAALAASTPDAMADVRGDFNRDGYADLAIGIPNAEVSHKEFAGEVLIQYGTPSGLESGPYRYLHQDSSSVGGAAERADHFGSALTVGDFDGDGFDDLVVGVRDEDVINGNAGAIHIFYGGIFGLTGYGSQMIWEERFGQLSETGDMFGNRLAAGDINGDGYDDVVVGEPNEDVGSRTDAGAVIVLYGSSGGVRIDTYRRIHQDSPGIGGAPERYDYFGSAVECADFNRDGIDDIAIGICGESVLGVDSSGGINIIYGATSWSATRSVFIDKGSPGIPGVRQTDAAFGDSLAAGDFDGDGYADLAVGAPNASIGSVAFCGSVSTFYGSSAGLSAAGAQHWSQSSTGVGGAPEWGDDFGKSLTAGDFDGDGYDELAIGVPGEGLGTTRNAGMLHVLWGTSFGLRGVASQSWHQDKPGIRGAAEENDEFGAVLAAGDFDGDGRDDLAVGVPLEGLGSRRAAGMVQVLFGRSSGLSSLDDEVLIEPAGGASGGARMGSSLGADT